MLEDLCDWLRIPSVSTGGGRAADLERGAAWVCGRVRRAGGEAELVPSAGNPLAVGRLRAREAGAPTVLIYGHYDVQGPGPLEAWDSPPFAPEVRDGRLYARGAADDKGNFLPLLHAACELHAAGALPVHVRVLVEGEEERDSASVLDWLRADAEGADAAIAFDALMVDERTPALTIGLRGLVMAELTVRTAARDLHSGLYGGAALNALHALHTTLAAVLPGAGGELPAPLRAGVRPPDATEEDDWSRLPCGAALLAEAGARPADARAAEQFHQRTWASPSVELHELRGGEPRTLVPAVASATLSMRLAAGQHAAAIAAALERLLRAAAPPGAEVTLACTERTDPVLFEPDAPALALAAEALERACGTRPALVRSGGSIPIVAALAQRGIPAIVSGFALPQDAIHAPNESYRLDALRAGEAAARELLRSLAALRG